VKYFYFSERKIKNFQKIKKHLIFIYISGIICVMIVKLKTGTFRSFVLIKTIHLLRKGDSRLYPGGKGV